MKGKAIKPANLSKTVSALGNTSGGEIYIGIDEAFHAHGVVRSWDGFENVEAANAHIQVIEEVIAFYIMVTQSNFLPRAPSHIQIVEGFFAYQQTPFPNGGGISTKFSLKN